MPPDLFVVVALSGRALAASAARAGHRCVVLDAFDDLDTRAIAAASTRVPLRADWTFEPEALLDAVGRLAPPSAPLVYGAGFERAGELLERLCADRPLLGNHPESVAAVKDPPGFAARLAALGIPHPETRLEPPANRRGWLVKRIGGAGGAHVRRATQPGTTGERTYFQRRVRGRPVSVLCLSDGRDAVSPGLSEQWSWERPDGNRCFAGAAMPANIADETARAMTAAAIAVVESFGLVGLNSIDFLLDGASFHALEVNARPGATIDVYDRALGVSLFDLHVRACCGRLPDVPERVVRSWASCVVFAPADLAVPQHMAWPDWAVDRSPGGIVIRAGGPVCTVLADGANAASARALVEQRRRKILDQMTPLDAQRPSAA